MKRFIKFSAIVIALLILTAITIQTTTLDGLTGLLALILEDSTQYSDGYSPTSFRKVKAGMTEDQVFALLGKPLDTHTVGGNLYLWYSIPMKSHFRDRRIILRDGVVTRKNTEFYVD